MMKNGKIANINTTIKNLFFRWLSLTKPFHKLTPQEQKVLGLLLYHNHKLRTDISNVDLRWKMVFDYDTKMLIQEEMNINNYQVRNVLTSLRKKGCIKNNQIVPTFVPNVEIDSKVFKLIFNFKIIDGKEV